MLSDEAVTISFGKWFQLSHTLFEKENLPISKLNLSLYSFGGDALQKKHKATSFQIGLG